MFSGIFSISATSCSLVIRCAHKRNFVGKCEVDSLVCNQNIKKPKEKNVVVMAYYIPTV